MYVYALDFDGVLCDSAYETACTGWKACQTEWPGLFNADISDEIINAFRIVRPVLKTGYESMILLYLLQKGKSTDEIIDKYAALKEIFYKNTGISAEKLKHVFGKTRDNWIESDFRGWLALNKFYSGVVDSVNRSPFPVYIVTTKQKRFTTALCEYAGLNLPETHIYGLESGEKSLSLSRIALQNQGSPILFVEDRLDNLLQANVNETVMHKFYADWGYGTISGHKAAQNNPQVTIIKLADFAQFMTEPEKFL